MHKDAWTEPADLLEMANMLGRKVKIENINFSFYFSFKTGMQHGIRVKIKWNRDRFRGAEDGYMDLHGQYDYVQSEHGEVVSETEISKAKAFFVKYKVLFAAVWEVFLEADDVQDYFEGNLTFDELRMSFYDFPKDTFKDAETVADIEKIVRENNLFDMND